MKMYIPSLGDDIRLTSDWSFIVHAEYRNADILEYFDYDYQDEKQFSVEYAGLTWRWNGIPFLKPCTLPAGTVLRIKRIFIRQGATDFDSVTFVTKLPTRGGNGKLTLIRFWAKLADVNKIDFEPVEETK